MPPTPRRGGTRRRPAERSFPQFARHTDNIELKRALALNRRIDAQQQKAVNDLNPGDHTPLGTLVIDEVVRSRGHEDRDETEGTTR